MDLLWTDFLNSEWRDWRGDGRSEDQLDKPNWQTRFLAAWTLEAPVPAGPEELAALRTLRVLVGRLAQAASAGEPLGPADLEALNAMMAGGPVVRQLAPGAERPQLSLRPARQDWSQVQAEIVASFARTLAEGEGARIHFCDNPNCRWAFYDDTRNRSKRFCDEKACGNLMKVRRFRARKKAES